MSEMGKVVMVLLGLMMVMGVWVLLVAWYTGSCECLHDRSFQVRNKEKLG